MLLSVEISRFRLSRKVLYEYVGVYIFCSLSASEWDLVYNQTCEVGGKLSDSDSNSYISKITVFDTDSGLQKFRQRQSLRHPTSTS